jgi:hypothetical protein
MPLNLLFGSRSNSLASTVVNFMLYVSSKNPAKSTALFSTLSKTPALTSAVFELAF